MRAVLQEDRIELTDSYLYKNLIKEIPGRRWHPDRKVWTVPATLESIEMLKPVAKLEGDIKEFYKEQQQLRRKTEGERLSTKVESLAPMPIKAIPFQHQIKGYNIALQIMGVMI
ncbi:MAG: hypothetical protein JJT76_06390 [Clostridiaceae bacterium]|nr:hypothetical protein [Clostridiaceae bacterium]